MVRKIKSGTTSSKSTLRKSAKKSNTKKATTRTTGEEDEKQYDPWAQLELINRTRTTLDLCEVYSLFGEKMSLMNARLNNKIIELQNDEVLGTGDLINSHLYKEQFRIGVRIGKQTFVAELHGYQKFCVKFEDVDMPAMGPNIAANISVILAAQNLVNETRRHIFSFCDYGRISNRFNYLVTPMYDQTLEDLRRTRVPGRQFRLSTAIRLALQTLEAIEQVHLCHFVHRDIQPKNFCITSKFRTQRIVYVIGFEFAYNYMSSPHDQSGDLKRNAARRRLEKLPLLDMRFQPRAYHRGAVHRCLHDVESWLYMCIYFFNTHLLPWKSNAMMEREIFDRKRLFFLGHYDDQLSQYVPRGIFSMRERIILHRDAPPVDYTFFGATVELTGAEFHVDWNGTFEWEKGDPEWAIDPAVNPNHKHTLLCKTCKKRIERMKAREGRRAFRVDSTLSSGRDPQKSKAAVESAAAPRLLRFVGAGDEKVQSSRKEATPPLSLNREPRHRRITGGGNAAASAAVTRKKKIFVHSPSPPSLSPSTKSSPSSGKSVKSAPLSSSAKSSRSSLQSSAKVSRNVSTKSSHSPSSSLSSSSASSSTTSSSENRRWRQERRRLLRKMATTPRQERASKDEEEDKTSKTSPSSSSVSTTPQKTSPAASSPIITTSESSRRHRRSSRRLDQKMSFSS